MEFRFFRAGPLAGAWLLSGVLSGVPVSLQAADGSSGRAIEEVVKIGVRQAYRGGFDELEDPQSVVTLDGELLDRAGIRDLVSAMDLSASVARQNNFGGLWNAFAVRGFPGDENLPSNYLVNGFNAGRGFAGPRDISGIESVEVLKGPKAALFGRGEPGGTINVVTKRPTFDTAGRVDVSAGQWNTFRLDADYTTPLSEQMAVRLVGFAENAESFRDTINTDRRGASPSLAVHFGDDTRLIYEMEWVESRVPFDRGVVAINGRLGDVDRSTFLGEPGDGPLVANVLGHQLELQHEFDERLSLLVGLTHRDTSLEGFSSEPELSGSRQLLNRGGSLLTRNRRFRDYDAIFTALRGEFAATFETGRLQHRLLFGADVDRFENDQVFRRARGPSLSRDPSLQVLQAIDVFAPVYDRYPLPDPSPLTDRVETQQAFGLYVQDQIAVNEQWQVRLGFRYDDFTQENDNRRSNSLFEQSNNRISPQVGVVYQVDDDLSLYAAYGEGFRQLTGTDVNGQGFDPNTTTSAEFGVKWRPLGGELLATASVFRLTQDNMLVGDPDNPFSLLAAGAARSSGFEVDVVGPLREGLDMQLSYAWINAETTRPTLDPNFNLPIASGDPLINVPDHSLSLQLQQQLTVMERPATLGGGLVFVGERLGETATDFMLDGYAVVRVFADYFPMEELRLRAEVDNLFDETFYTNSFARLWVQPGTPRMLRLTATWTW